MSQTLEVNIKATSEIPQAMDKAKAAVVGFDKQIEGIGKKFSSSFKDIFLSFLGPMAILSAALAFIGKAIADNQRKNEEANRAAIDGTNELMSAQDRYYTRKRENEKLTKEQIEQAKLERENVTKEFLQNDPRGKALVMEQVPEGAGGMKRKDFIRDSFIADQLAKRKQTQDIVQSLIAEDIKNNPAAAQAPTGPTSFRTPEGFGNVVGVGANPVMEAMTMQLEESRKQTALLESLNNKSPGGGVPVDFTKPQPLNAASRSGSI